jgi:Stage II sporulation protein E (SpoIIE)
MRNARRARSSILEQAAAAHWHLAEQFPGPDFVTGLVELDVDSGSGTMLNTGHPPPLLLVRDGAVSELLVPPELPLGLLVSTEYPVHRSPCDPVIGCCCSPTGSSRLTNEASGSSAIGGWPRYLSRQDQGLFANTGTP